MGIIGQILEVSFGGQKIQLWNFRHIWQLWALLYSDGKFYEAESSARKALELNFMWGCSWDKRMAWEAWIAWNRVLLQRSVDRISWPTSSWGVINYGLVR